MKNCAYLLKKILVTPLLTLSSEAEGYKKKGNAMTPSDKYDTNLIYFVLFPAASGPKSEF